ncbi:MAG: hypothetical protein OEY20_01940 [Gemmatimonadota bacterium]|nr:hypothetical protein [Gemmatimonadota bacterium]MDH4350712.1 hypothetical protein [Gemmatimonadota bacterium]MDH5195994.1 hypothetical protein [Gemmatimonadota bacterium]
MTELAARLSTALAGRYRIERELGQAGMAATAERRNAAAMSDPLAHLTAALADRCTIERELGQGGMATVYLTEDLKHQRRVAGRGNCPWTTRSRSPVRWPMPWATRMPALSCTGTSSPRTSCSMDPRFRAPGWSFNIIPGGDVIYLQSPGGGEAQYVRVVPG